MPKYRIKPVVLEAEPFNRESARILPSSIGER